jgi:hypothetical protein
MRAARQPTRASRPFSLNQTGTLSRRHLAHFLAAVDKGFGFYLRKAWAVAKAAKERRLAQAAPEPAAIADAPMSEMGALLWGAQMIDSTRRSFAAQAAIRARFTSLAA